MNLTQDEFLLRLRQDSANPGGREATVLAAPTREVGEKGGPASLKQINIDFIATGDVNAKLHQDGEFAEHLLLRISSPADQGGARNLWSACDRPCTRGVLTRAKLIGIFTLPATGFDRLNSVARCSRTLRPFRFRHCGARTSFS